LLPTVYPMFTTFYVEITYEMQTKPATKNLTMQLTKGRRAEA
jgi:hypothetical protein